MCGGAFMEFNEKLKERMIQKNISTKEFAEMLFQYGSDGNLRGTPKSYVRKVQKWLSGSANPRNLEELEKICNILDCDFSYLLDESPIANMNNKKVAEWLGLDEIVISNIKSYDDTIKKFMSVLIRANEVDNSFGDILLEFLNIMVVHGDNSTHKTITIKDNITGKIEKLDGDKATDYIMSAVKNMMESIFYKVSIIGMQIGSIRHENKRKEDEHKWKEEYEINLTESFSDFDAYCINMNNPKAVNAVKRNYIKSVLLCDAIDIEHSQEILMYFLLSKRNIDELILCDCFIEHYEIIKELQQNIDSSDIKQKLKTKQQRKISKYTIDDIDLMTGTEFEEFIALLFKKMGYSSQVTKQSGDQGIDVIAIKNNTRIGIQAKCYSNAVGNAAIQEAVAGKNFYNCDKTVVVTNNYFTTAAIDLAQANNVILWNRDLLKEKIKELL